MLANLFQRATTMAAIAGSSLFKAAAGIATGGLLGVAYKLDQEVACAIALKVIRKYKSQVRADLTLHAPSLPWSHSGNFDSLDHASIR